MVLWNYVGGNPVNFTDPSGLFQSPALFRTLVPGQVAWDNALTSFENGNYALGGMNLLAMVGEQVMFAASFGQSGMVKQGGQCVKEGSKTVIGRVKDLQNLAHDEQSLLSRLPDKGFPKANWKQNSGVLRSEMKRNLPIRDASPGDITGQFLNAERYLLQSRGWTFDSNTSYWMPPVK